MNDFHSVPARNQIWQTVKSIIQLCISFSLAFDSSRSLLTTIDGYGVTSYYFRPLKQINKPNLIQQFMLLKSMRRKIRMRIGNPSWLSASLCLSFSQSNRSLWFYLFRKQQGYPLPSRDVGCFICGNIFRMRLQSFTEELRDFLHGWLVKDMKRQDMKDEESLYSHRDSANISGTSDNFKQQGILL